MKKLAVISLLSLTSLIAENSGGFLGGGFQYSNLDNQQTTRSPGFNNDTQVNLSALNGTNTPQAPQTQTSDSQKNNNAVNTNK
ncbi:hypothetical protein [Helicobacter cetorum]|uniref:hypothetical protein n=1 Tax=Helicobacter cetorum TaxID=138563 RepID=UPI000CF0FECB|nr:hypothetical protein [Helicobacter cetorum]